MNPFAVASDLMAGNFFALDRADSRHLAARKAALASNSSMAERQNAVLVAGMVESAHAETYAGMALAGRRAARRIQREQQAAVGEHARDNLTTLKKRLEAKAEEAPAPEGAGGPAAGMGAAPAPNAGDAVSSRTPAGDPSIAAGLTTGSATGAATPAPETGDGSVAAPVVSVDIFV